MKIITTVAFCIALVHLNLLANWRSSLYPEGWFPGSKDAEGRFLHDFSYAGYHQGEREIPDNPSGAIYDVTQPPYSADNSGTTDATASIQSAINDASSTAGGIVYLPPGTYNVSPGSNSYGLRIQNSGVVIRGAGTDQTFICNTEMVMRGKKVFLFQPSSGNWHTPLSGSSVDMSEDCGYPLNVIPLENVAGFNVGDTVILRTDCTDDFIADHQMSGIWDSSLLGITFCRRITAIDTIANTITIDIPTRYYLKIRDNARVYKVAPHMKECGIEDLSIGMLEHTGSGWGDDDYAIEGTGAYEVHGCHLIFFRHAMDCWARRVNTYRPPTNIGDYHMLSNGIQCYKSIHITVKDCDVRRPQYEGGGGNGYGYMHCGNDCLIQECIAVHTRHNYDFKSMWTSGNVFHRCRGETPRLASDFHMHLSVANLFDSTTVDGDWLQAVYRPYGTVIHGHSTTESVFWNTYGIGSGTAVQSSQWGWGYVIGTSGGRHSVERNTSYNSAPLDFLEGEGSGDTLEPQSLYEDQLFRRLHSNLPQPNPLNYILLENFEMYPLENAINGHGSWAGNTTSTDEFSVRVDPDDISNQVLHFNEGVNSTVFLNTPELTITNGTISTLFFRLRAEPSDEANGGLFFRVSVSDVTSPVNFSDGETDLTYSDSSPTTISVNGTQIATNQWHNFWMVIDNSNDTFDLYLSHGSDTPSRIITDNAFRNGLADNDILSLMLKTYNNNGIGSDGNAWIDDIYIAHGLDAHLWTPIGDNRDQDNLSDSWELKQFRSVDVSSGNPDEDQDSDDFIDINEWLAGTEATNSASLLALETITPSSNTGETILSWQSVNEISYSVQGKVNITDIAWNTITNGLPGVPPSNTYTVGAERIERFFRVLAN